VSRIARCLVVDTHIVNKLFTNAKRLQIRIDVFKPFT